MYDIPEDPRTPSFQTKGTVFARPEWVSRRIVIWVTTDDQLPAPLDADLIYESADPYAITLVIGSAHAAAVEWKFARDLLAQGLYGPAGEGDVVVAPQDMVTGRFVRIQLRTSQGVAWLEARRSDVVAFLSVAEELVPQSMEHQYLDIDGLLQRITAATD